MIKYEPVTHYELKFEKGSHCLYIIFTLFWGKIMKCFATSRIF